MIVKDRCLDIYHALLASRLPMKLLGIEFAPFLLPLKRRFQTFCMFIWFMQFLLLGPTIVIITTYLLFTKYYWITILLYSWTWYDRQTPQRGGRRSDYFRSLSVFKGLADYFPMRLHKSEDLDPSKNYVAGFHPHGIFAVGAFTNFASEATGFKKLFPGIRSSLLTLRGQFFFPIYRDYIMLSGACDVSKESVNYLLNDQGKGNMVVIVVGGAIEMLEAHPDQYTVHLKTRKGFIKKALETGSQLVPIYSFGETDMFNQVPNPKGSKLRWLQTKLKVVNGYPLTPFYGRGIFNYTFGIVPHRKSINTVVGKPIDVEKTENPSQEAIDSLHDVYCKALQTLFDDYKTKFGISENKYLAVN
ncbi:2-acylglycerol O-acyltransferase 2-like [Antedon mediterranea]|uniref:2-acylglycerol O-acyltransferase 2-like n=1 Tax=Antedon mediterranea TaxID=105859 RepID=UPI003AF5F4C2